MHLPIQGQGLGQSGGLGGMRGMSMRGKGMNVSEVDVGEIEGGGEMSPRTRFLHLSMQVLDNIHSP